MQCFEVSVGLPRCAVSVREAKSFAFYSWVVSGTRPRQPHLGLLWNLATQQHAIGLGQRLNYLEQDRGGPVLFGFLLLPSILPIQTQTVESIGRNAMNVLTG